VTVLEAINNHATRTPDHPSLVIADGPTLDYASVASLIDGLADQLLQLGVSRTDTVGIALRDGPEMALSFLGVGAVCTAAPLNPSYRHVEFDFEIEDLTLAAMLVGTGPAEIPAATAAARERGVPVLRVSSSVTGSGCTIVVTGDQVGPPAEMRRNEGDDVALVLHTSGTTSRPKIVPLRHAGLMASAGAIGRTLSLQPTDRCCNVMPLFHIHGLVAGLCSSLVAGAAVICTPGFSAADMPRWMTAHEASWYTAVPTMHQALVERQRSHPHEFSAIDLRFVRSSSSSLAPTVMADLEALFDCPVVEAYGMTEAAHQMTCNDLPPGQRKPGSVGPAAGPEVAVMDEVGRLVATGVIGEVVIKGPNVMAGYHANDEANAVAFTNGWLRTGDQGRLDDDGFLFLTGRLKEIINRGGEKVSPREIDEVLLEHPAVAQVVTFAVDDTRLGEQVAAAVVVRSEARDLDERSLREFAALSLAPYKVPRRIVFVDTIPKGPSGKLRRIGLADQLGLADLDAREAATQHVAPTTAAELLMAELWEDVLGRAQIGATEHFLDVGGDSLAATRLLTRVRDEIDVEVSMLDFFDAPTIIEQGRLIEQLLLSEASTS
jgi:acyl-CoA synthetase (AMP-forming)/AMP-acid ligase II/acyl carrier protein